MSEIEICECCGAKMVKYTHRLNKPLVSAMIRMYAKYKLSPVKISEMLSHSQVCNFQKLKYWGLVEKCENEGFWKLTKTAETFIKGLTSIQLKVVTFRGKVVEAVDTYVQVDDIIEGYQHREDYLNECKSVKE